MTLLEQVPARLRLLPSELLLHIVASTVYGWLSCVPS